MTNYRCSIGQIEEAEKTGFWLDVVDELKAWLEDIRDRLEDPNNELHKDTIFRLQGNAEALRRVMLLPEMIRNNIVADLKGEDVKEGE